MTPFFGEKVENSEFWRILFHWMQMKGFTSFHHQRIHKCKKNKYNQIPQSAWSLYFQIGREKFCGFWNLLRTFGKEFKAMSNIGHDTTVYTALNKWHDIATACISRRPVTTNGNKASNKKKKKFGISSSWSAITELSTKNSRNY